MAIASARGVQAPGLWSAAGGRRLLPYLLLIPALAMIGVVVVYPLLYTTYLSLFDYNLLRPAQGRVFLGLGNYLTVAQNPAFWTSLRATLTYTAGTVAASFGLGLGTAMLLNASFPARGIARALIILPWTIPWLVTTLIWYAVLNPQFGPLNAILAKAGLIRQGIPWLYQTGTAMMSIIAVTAWRLFPKVTLFLLAGLQTIPKERYEAASIDGAGELAKFRHITLPGLRAVNYVVVMLLTISSFKLFTVAWVLTSGGPGQATRLLSIYTFEESLRFYRVGIGSTIATMMMLVSAVLVLAYYVALRKGEDRA